MIDRTPLEALREIANDYCNGKQVQHVLIEEVFERFIVLADEKLTRPEATSSEKAEWLIWSNEHRAYWGPQRCGYPMDPRRAGVYTLSEARDICRSRSWMEGPMPPETMIHESEVCYGLRLPQLDHQSNNGATSKVDGGTSHG